MLVGWGNAFQELQLLGTVYTPCNHHRKWMAPVAPPWEFGCHGLLNLGPWMLRKMIATDGTRQVITNHEYPDTTHETAIVTAIVTAIYIYIIAEKRITAWSCLGGSFRGGIKNDVPWRHINIVRTFPISGPDSLPKAGDWDYAAVAYQEGVRYLVTWHSKLAARRRLFSAGCSSRNGFIGILFNE